MPGVFPAHVKPSPVVGDDETDGTPAALHQQCYARSAGMADRIEHSLAGDADQVAADGFRQREPWSFDDEIHFDAGFRSQLISEFLQRAAEV